MNRRGFSIRMVPKTGTKAKCEVCGATLEKRTRNQRYCSECTPWNGSKQKNLRAHLDRMNARLQIEADCSGNLKVWSSATCTQEFLRSLIPA
jgi:hypothetical protein